MPISAMSSPTGRRRPAFATASIRRHSDSTRSNSSGLSPARMTPLTLADFDYSLPPELIAQHPARERAGSRLLHVDANRLDDLRFADLPTRVLAGDLLVFNDTRVIKARLRGRKATGGEVELLIERITGPDTAVAQLRASHAPRPGTTIEFLAGVHAIVQSREDRLYALQFIGTDSLDSWLDRHGEVPLPPYITHPPDATDAERYQT